VIPRNRSIAALLAAEALSSLGSRMTWLALPWFVLVTTGSPTRMGIVFAIEVVPMALFGIPSGTVVQRFGARRTMLVCDGARAPLVALVPLLHAFGALPFGLLLAIVFALGLFTAPYFASQRLVLPEVVGEDEQRVSQANSLIEGTTRFTGLMGPAIAGLAIGAIGAANVIWIDAGTYVVSVLLVGTMVPRRAPTPVDETARGVLAGLRYVVRDSVLAPAAFSILLIGLFVPTLFAGLPVLGFERYGRSAATAGALAASWSGGALAGSLGAFRLAGRFPPLRLAALAAPWFALPIWVLVFDLPAWAIAAALAVSGLAVPFVNAPLMMMLTLRTPATLRGKVMTTVSTAEYVTQPAGYALSGPTFVGLGLGGAFALVAAGLTLGTLVFTLTLRRAAGTEMRVVEEAA
jgi:MFS family permease